MNHKGLFGIIGVIGGILMIFSAFHVWVEIELWDYTLLDITGIEIFREWTDIIDMKYAILPVFTIVCGFVVIIMMAVTILDDNERYRKLNIALGFATIVLSIVVIIYSILFVNKTWDFWGWTIHLSDYLAIGFWISMVGSVASLLGGFVPLFRNKRYINDEL